MAAPQTSDELCLEKGREFTGVRGLERAELPRHFGLGPVRAEKFTGRIDTYPRLCADSSVLEHLDTETASIYCAWVASEDIVALCSH